MRASEQGYAGGRRFTLRALLVGIAAIAVVATWVNSYRIVQRNRLLEAENRRLRDEVGELSVDDESRLHAIRVASKEEFDWTWRVSIPEGHVYRLRVVGDRIPGQGFPDEGGAVFLREPGEHFVRYRIQRDPRDNRWSGTLSTRGASTSSTSGEWVEWGSRTATTDGVGATTEAFAPDERVVLARYRVSQARSSSDIEDPSAGFLIWLEPGN
jgi:hypothetical protein